MQTYSMALNNCAFSQTTAVVCFVTSVVFRKKFGSCGRQLWWNDV